MPSADADERTGKLLAQTMTRRIRTIICRTADSQQNDELLYIRLTIIQQERYKAVNGPSKTTRLTNKKNDGVAVSNEKKQPLILAVV